MKRKQYAARDGVVHDEDLYITKWICCQKKKI
jgi:hypothetical protein